MLGRVVAAASLVGCTFSGANIEDAGADSPDAAPDATTTGTFVFQQNLNGYTGTLDTYLAEGDALSVFGDRELIIVDANDAANGAQWGALRFDGMFAANGGPIPDGASIGSATLRIVIDDEGSPVNFRNALTSWSEASVWADFGVDLVLGGNASEMVAATTPNLATGAIALVVTSSVSAWSSDPSANLGWFLEGTQGNGVEFVASEGTANRPRLEVVVVP